MAADSIWTNGLVYSMDASRRIASAIAVRDGRVVHVGSDAEVNVLSDAKTKRHDLRGRFVMPGLIDTHTHGLWGACRDLFECYVGYTASIADLLAAVAVRVHEVPAGEWITGGPWRLEQLRDYAESPRSLLDKVAPDHPVALKDTSQHNLWLNSKALEICGIDHASADVEGGHIERDPQTQQPLGVLSENAGSLVQPHLAPSPVRLSQAVRHMVTYFNSLGIVGFKEPMAYEADLVAYCNADAEGTLHLHVAAHLSRTSPFAPGRTPLETMRAWRETYRSRHVATGYAKLFLDGVAPSRTAAFLEAYLPAPGYDPAGHDPEAMLLLKPDDLNNEVIELDRQGFVVKMHAVGDRAVRAGLDAIEAARRANGDSGLRHEIAHVPFIHASDLPRFAALGAVAEVSPKLWFPNPVTSSQYAVLGRERTNRCHPIRSLLDAGAEVIYGSDWPASAPDANPWIGLAGMMTRKNPFGAFPDAIGEDQAISLERALPLFTTNAARALGLGDITGSIEVGKSADFIVLDRSLFEMSPEQIAATQVAMTVFEGNVVFER